MRGGRDLACVRRGELEALQLGGRGQWRIERSKLEEFIASAYEHTARQLRQRPPSANDAATVEEHDGVEERQDDDQDDE